MLQILHIYFQSGDFTIDGGQDGWLIDLLINSFGAFLGVLGALVLYYLQLRCQQKDKLKYIVTLVDSTIAYARTQSEYCENLIQRLMQEPTKLHLLHIEANYDLKRLADKLDQEGFYHAYLAKYNRKKNTYQTFRKIYSHIDFIDHTIDQLIDFLEKENISIHDKKKNYVAYLEEGEEKVTLLTVNPNYQNQNVLLEFLNHKLVQYKQTPHDDTDLNYPYTAFIDPVLNHLVHNYPTDIGCNEIAVLLRRSAAKYHAIIRQSTELAYELVNYRDQLKKHANQLENETKKLRTDYNKGM